MAPVRFFLRMHLGISVYFGCRGEKHPGLQLERQRGEKRDEEREMKREREGQREKERQRETERES